MYVIYNKLKKRGCMGGSKGKREIIISKNKKSYKKEILRNNQKAIQ